MTRHQKREYDSHRTSGASHEEAIKRVLRPVATYSENFTIAIDAIEAKCKPIRIYNMARALTLMERDLVDAMRRFKAKLEYNTVRRGWYVQFEDGSSFEPAADALKLLRRPQLKLAA